jgi:hypothetical protein
VAAIDDAVKRLEKMGLGEEEQVVACVGEDPCQDVDSADTAIEVGDDEFWLLMAGRGLPARDRRVLTVVAKQAAGVRSLAVKPQLHRAYNDRLAERFSRYAWASPSCSSYYQDARGRTPFLFPGRFTEYVKLHDQSGLHEYDLTTASTRSRQR